MACSKIISRNVHKQTCRVSLVSSVHKTAAEDLSSSLDSKADSASCWVRGVLDMKLLGVSVKEKGPILKFKAQLEDTCGAWWHMRNGWKFLEFCATFFTEKWGSGKRLGSGDLNSITVTSILSTGLLGSSTFPLLLSFPIGKMKWTGLLFLKPLSFYNRKKCLSHRPSVPMKPHLVAQIGWHTVSLPSLWWREGAQLTHPPWGAPLPSPLTPGGL